jgi:hypothetical protein
MRPTTKPANPNFSSGPCAKRPGWSPAALAGALTGRSHRSKPGKAKLAEVIDRTRAILGVPDDWRLTVTLEREDAAEDLVRWLHEVEVEGRARDLVGERVIVSRDGRRVFLYTDGEERARSVGRMIAARLGHPDRLNVELARWHPVEQSWEDPSVPLPRTREEWEAEHQRLQEREAAESWRSGEAAWEVRVELPGHDETTELADRLEAEGIPVVRRYTFLLVGAANEDEAHELADRLREETPESVRIEVEPGGRIVWEVAPSNPFVVFGGLGV